METERKALYNSLRLNWLRKPYSFAVESWQIEDLRSASTQDLFDRLINLGVMLDASIFDAVAEKYDSPEELADELLSVMKIPQVVYDKAYLCIFEIWRRLLPEKQTLSLFCDELDHQIHLYDTGNLENEEAFQDILNALLELLNENADSGIAPKKVFESIMQGTANDIEEFLYDFISDQIDEGNRTYAKELIEGFFPYVSDLKWFYLASMRIAVEKEGIDLTSALADLLKKAKNADVEFYLEVLAFLTKRSDPKTFQQIAKKILPLLETEEDLVDFLSLSAEFYHLLDDEAKEKKIMQLMDDRPARLKATIKKEDPIFKEIRKIFS